MPTPKLTLFTGLLAGCLLTVHAQAQEVSDLLRYVPSDANTLAVLRVKELTQSPRGQKEGWAEKHESEFLQGAATIPPWVPLFVRSSYVRPGTRGGDWTVVLLPLPPGHDISQLAAREGTEVQMIGERPAVASHRFSGYFVEFDGEAGKILGGISPGTRQDAARWVRDVGGAGKAPVSDYLADAAAANSADQIVLAIDLTDMLDPIMVRNRINQSAVIAQNPGHKAALVVDFQSLRGARLTIRTEEQTTAEIRLDFGRDIGDEGQHMRALLEEFLNDAGAALDELADAGTSVFGRRVTFNMPLSDESLRRVLSLITTPPPPSAPGRQAPTPAAPAPTLAEAKPEAAASMRYFRNVNRILDDLEKARARSSNYARTAQWHFNFADKIDRLPTAGVDQALLKYGSDISSKLRAVGSSLRGTAVQVNTLDKTVVYNVEQYPMYQSGFDWWWGGAYTAYGPYNYGMPSQTYTNVTSNLQEVRQKQAEVVQASEPERNQIWQMINDERSATEREMISKYGADFQKR
jgi:hypothetical protein